MYLSVSWNLLLKTDACSAAGNCCHAAHRNRSILIFITIIPHIAKLVSYNRKNQFLSACFILLQNGLRLASVIRLNLFMDPADLSSDIRLQEPSCDFKHLRRPVPAAVACAEDFVKFYLFSAVRQLLIHELALFKGHHRVHISVDQ